MRLESRILAQPIGPPPEPELCHPPRVSLPFDGLNLMTFGGRFPRRRLLARVKVRDQVSHPTCRDLGALQLGIAPSPWVNTSRLPETYGDHAPVLVSSIISVKFQPMQPKSWSIGTHCQGSIQAGFCCRAMDWETAWQQANPFCNISSDRSRACG